ncbi:MAG: hypothetical protein WBE72_23450 [Terracidiphilus sp.]
MSIAHKAAEKIPEQLKLKEWVSAVHVGFQQQIVTFLLWAYGFLLAATVTIIFFQGFHFKGFALDSAFLKWLGGATIGEIGGLLVFTFRASFK